MKKLFKAIRAYDLVEVKAILEKKPELVNCVAVAPPKKDNGQSPLQVALKIGAFEIADYLMKHGADVNFMEAEDEDSGVRCPVLFDAINATMVNLCYRDEEASDTAMGFVEELLKRGADPNKIASNDFCAINMAVSKAELILDSTIYDYAKDKAESQLVVILDLLMKYGADFNKWANSNHYPGNSYVVLNRTMYLDDFGARGDHVERFEIRGKVHETVVKGCVDRTEKTRALMKRYAMERGLQY